MVVSVSKTVSRTGNWTYDDLGDLRLRPGSPCIDDANNAAVPPDINDLDGDENTSEPIPVDLDENPPMVLQSPTLQKRLGILNGMLSNRATLLCFISLVAVGVSADRCRHGGRPPRKPELQTETSVTSRSGVAARIAFSASGCQGALLRT